MLDARDLDRILAALDWFDREAFGERGVERLVRRRMEALALTSPKYVELLTRSAEERLLLIEELAVPETFFLRHEQAFAALADWATDRAVKAPGHSVKILCAACSTGEEPYSVALTLIEAGLPTSFFKIDAIDISRRHLAVAREAEYGANSFRSPAARRLRDVWFAATGTRYRLNAEARDTVTFAQADLCAGPPNTGTRLYDAIFCRNVLIYFTELARNRALANVQSLLTPNGLLFLGPCDLPLACRQGFVPYAWPMSFAVQKAADVTGRRQQRVRRPRTTTATARQGSQPLGDENSPREAHGRVSLSKSPAPAQVAPTAEVDDLAEATALADKGRFAEALRALSPRLDANRSDPRAYVLLGLINDATGNRAAAEGAYRKALYLDPANREAALNLCLLLESDGRSAAAAPVRRRLGK